MTHSKIEMLSPELQVSDLDRSIDFYRRAFGFEVSWSVSEPEKLACLCRDNVEFTLRVADPDGNQIGLGESLDERGPK
jgi:catechol 2,3-dioxygenase-like lactoylglutathione lyase family enzyme